VAVLCLTGNHDVIEDGTGAHPLLAVKEVYLEDARVVVADSPRYWSIWNGRSLVQDECECNVLALPYVARSHAYDPVEAVAGFVQNDAKPDLVVGHLNIAGATPGSETEDMPRGREVVYPVDAVRKAWPGAVLVNGHYHKAGECKGVHHPGALARLTFGEEEHVPGFLVVEV
jgi:hypothetical protein